MFVGPHHEIVVLLAGVAFFMFGMTLASDSLQKLMANRVRELLGKLSKNKVLAISVGIGLTTLLQSSGAVTSMLVGLGSAGVITLPQVMGVIVGSAIGTTVTVQLISFNIAEWGLPVFALSFAVYFVSGRRPIKTLMGVLMGFGLIFLGIEMIGVGAEIFKKFEIFRNFFSQLSSYPLLSMLVAFCFCAFVHSSAVTIGFAMGLAGSEVITLYDAMFWVYGANIGTTSTAILASFGGNYVGRQVAWAHFFYKFVTVLIFSFITRFVVGWFETYDLNVQRDIANGHLLYNLVAALIFYPFITIGANWIARFIGPGPTEKEFGAKYLERATYQSSALALAHASRELFRMGDIVHSMIKDSILLFKGYDPDLEESIKERDNRVDLLFNEIKLFLLEYANETKEGVSRQVFEMISFANNLESAADVIDNSLLVLARKKQNLKLEFSELGWKELRRFHAEVIEVAQMSLSCFQLQDRELAAKLIQKKRETRKAEEALRESHFSRLNERKMESINTSSIHLDVLNDFRRIIGEMSNHAYSQLRRQDHYESFSQR